LLKPIAFYKALYDVEKPVTQIQRRQDYDKNSQQFSHFLINDFTKYSQLSAENKKPAKL
jgi:hypothetical protein